MRRSGFRDPGSLHGLPHRLLHHRLVHVMTPAGACLGIKVPGGGREHPLPTPFPIGIKILSRQRVRKLDSPVTLAKILLV